MGRFVVTHFTLDPVWFSTASGLIDYHETSKAKWDWANNSVCEV